MRQLLKLPINLLTLAVGRQLPTVTFANYVAKLSTVGRPTFKVKLQLLKLEGGATFTAKVQLFKVEAVQLRTLHLNF